MEKQKIKLNRKVLSKEKECEISLDVIVPDIKPDIIAITNTNANSYIYKEEISKGKIRLDGNVDGYVVYLSENGETRSLAINMDFIESLEDDSISENMRFKTSIKLQNIETKILNERKISVSSKIKLYVEFYEEIEEELLRDIEDNKNIQKMEETYKLKNLIGNNKSKASLKEDMVLEDNQSIIEILKTEMDIANFENKISYNKVLAKADVNIKIVYQTEEMKVGVLKGTYPVMSFIDIENVDEKNMCETEFKLRNMLFKINSVETNKITVQLDFESYVEVYDSQDITVIQDMYSLDKEIEFTKKEIEISLDGETKTDNIKLNEKVMIEDINNIIDVGVNVNIINKTISGAYTNYELDTVLDIMYETDNMNAINSRKVNFPCNFKLETESKNVEFIVSKKEFTLNNEEVNCDMEIECKLIKDNCKKISILNDIEEKECETKNEYSMVVYFVKPCDTIWKIAKMFKVTTESIMEVNNLENPDKIKAGEKLYIVR